MLSLIRERRSYQMPMDSVKDELTGAREVSQREVSILADHVEKHFAHGAHAKNDDESASLFSSCERPLLSVSLGEYAL